MAATYEYVQSNGAGNTLTALAASGNIMNFQTGDTAVPADYSTNVITASDAANGGNSRELWFRGHWTGTFNTITNLKLWTSPRIVDSAGSFAGLTVKYACTATYATPTVNDTSVTTGQTSTTTIPTSVPGSSNIGIANSLSGTLSAAGYSDYIILQLHASTLCAPGDTALGTYILQYDET